MMAAYPRLFSLTGKVCVVTGGTRRYGRAISEALAEAGGTVLVTSRDRQRAEEVAGELRARGLEARGYALDQASDESIEACLAAVCSDHGRIDVLVNCARHLPRAVDRTELDLTFSINCTGLILLTRRVAELMKEAGGGNMINIGSIYGLGGQYPDIYADPEASLSWDYALQKGGVIAWTRQLATTLAAHRIRANCLSLGGLADPPHDEFFLQCYSSRVPTGRMATAEDVKGPIIFLASEASAYMTGANLVVDGGWTAW
jgi:NAD(P)-dependent dehydrogenase (short-subunit alcohol dehydrogenase family)